MRDLLANFLARLQATNRQQRLYIALGLVVAIVLLRFGAGWFVEYRDDLKADIRLTAQRLAAAQKLLERAPDTEDRARALRSRYRTTVARLVPGDTPTLAAAELQDLVSNLAAKNDVRIQTTQVLRDEALGSFRQVSLRVTASGEIRSLAGLLSELEFGDLQVSIPFLELSRRGASVRRRGNKAIEARAVSATFQVAGVVAGSAELPDEAAAAGAPAAAGREDSTALAAAPSASAPRGGDRPERTGAPPPPRDERPIAERGYERSLGQR